MQDIQMLGTGGGGGGDSDSRIFSSGVVDRRLRTQNGINQLQQALKCPRCDSLNTKFCYYNNYNLSQPRHFCKGCRRYWTKGGVLRKVPVGGGCRKAKRTARPRQSTTPPVVVSATDPDANDHKDKDNSSSESSSLTAGEAASGNTSLNSTLTAAEPASGNTLLNSAPPSFNFVPECNFFASFIDQASECAGSMFPEIGSLMASSEGMMTSSREVGFAVGEISTFVNEKDDEERKRCDQDQTAEIDSGIFDLTGAVDQTYWIQSQWPDHADHSAFHYLP